MTSQTLDNQRSANDTSVRPGLGQAAEVRPPSRRRPARFSFFSSRPDTPGFRWGGEKREKLLTPFEMASYSPAQSPTDRSPSKHSHSHRERWTMISHLRAGGLSLLALALAVILGSSATAF